MKKFHLRSLFLLSACFASYAFCSVEVTLQKIVGDDRDNALLRTNCTLTSFSNVKYWYEENGHVQKSETPNITLTDDTLAKVTESRTKNYSIVGFYIREQRPNVKYEAVLHDQSKGETSSILLEEASSALRKRDGAEAEDLLKQLKSACD